LDVKAGTVVQTGQVLGTFKSPELESQLAQESSTLISLQAELRRQQIQSQQMNLQNQQGVGLLEVELGAARRALARAEKSREEGILNAVDFEQAKDDLQVAELKLELARKEAEFEVDSLDFEVQTRRSNAERQLLVVTELERKVEELTIRSPVDGLVSRLLVEPGEAVGSNAPLITVVDLSAFDIEIAVAENYADEISSGTEAVITLDGVQYPGQVKSISPEVEGARVKGTVTFGDHSPATLKQNQRVSTRLILETREDVVKVPRGPFLEAGGGRQAYVVADGLAVLRPIQVGSLSVTDVEIISGLEIGEQIILSDTSRFDGAQTVLLRD
jgi:HlyD family secretion protein